MYPEISENVETDIPVSNYQRASQKSAGVPPNLNRYGRNSNLALRTALAVLLHRFPKSLRKGSFLEMDTMNCLAKLFYSFVCL